MGLFDRIRGRVGKKAETDATEEASAQTDLREHVIELLQSGFEGESVIEAIEEDEDDDLVFEVVFASEKRQVVNLAALYAETGDLEGDERDERLDRFVRGIVSSAADADGVIEWDEVKDRLVPVLRAVQHYVALPAAQRPPHHRFDDGVLETVAIDFDDTIRQITAPRLKAWGVTLDEILRAAAKSFGAVISADDVERFDADAPYPTWHVARDDDYQSSRRLLPSWLASFRGKVNGRPIAIVPDRNKCIVAGDATPRLSEA
jgi:uncharacterized protein YtpQ (UPF0354 family)